jgi:Ca-activated chloride channel homolog
MQQLRLRALGLICLSLFTLIVLSFWPRESAVHAGFDETSGSLGIVSKDGSVNSACPLRHTEVRGAISGFLSRVSVTQTFENTAAQKIEAVYAFPLPENAEVDDMTIRVGTRTVRGIIKKRDEAQAIYEHAKQTGHVTALLNQERPNIFTQSVANIMPGEQVVVTISYLQTLEYEDGAYQFVFPMVVGPRYIPGQPIGKQAGGWAPDTNKVPDASKITPPDTPPGTRAGHDISIELAIDAGVPLLQLHSSTHEIDVVRTGASTAAIKLKNLTEIPNKDFVLKYDVASEQITDAVLSQASAANSKLGPGGYFTLILQPPARLPEFDITPKELVFVLDTSGSMMGFPIEKAKELINHALDGLYPGDTFNLITFSGDTRILFPEPAFPTVENLREAREVLNAQHGSGGTEMMKAIRAALTPSDSQDHVRIVCFATDGLVGNDLDILSEVQKHPNARVFAYGIGNSVNRFLIESMARAGHGDSEVVTLKDDADAAAHRLYERLRSPVLTDVSVDWGGLPVSDVYPKQLPDLFSGKPLVITGHYTAAANGTVHIRGKRAGDDFTRDINVSLNSRAASNSILASFWARRKIDDLMSQDWAGLQRGNVKPQVQAEITEIGLNYNLMTQFTSFVAVEERIVTTDGKPQRVEVPVEMPEGMSYEGVFGERKNWLAAPNTVSLHAQMSIATKANRASNGVVSGVGGGIVGPAAGGGFGGGTFHGAAPTSAAPRTATPVTVVAEPSSEPVKPKRDTERAILESKLSPTLLDVFDCWKKQGSDCNQAKDGTVELQLFLKEDTAAVIDKLKALGLSGAQERTKEKMIVGRLPLDKLTEVAKMEAVVFVTPVRR